MLKVPGEEIVMQMRNRERCNMKRTFNIGDRVRIKADDVFADSEDERDFRVRGQVGTVRNIVYDYYEVVLDHFAGRWLLKASELEAL